MNLTQWENCVSITLKCFWLNTGIYIDESKRVAAGGKALIIIPDCRETRRLLNSIRLGPLHCSQGLKFTLMAILIHVENVGKDRSATLQVVVIALTDFTKGKINSPIEGQQKFSIFLFLQKNLHFLILFTVQVE